MVDSIVAKLPDSYITGSFAQATSFYFSLGDYKKTVEFTGDSCTVTDGKATENADCVCKTSPEFFLKIWQENYRPGVMDFMAGTIKSNNPGALQDFLRSFGKDT